MSVTEEGTGRTNEAPRPRRERTHPSGLDAVVVGLSGLFMLTAGAWASVSPRSFAEIGIGVSLLLALVWRDALATALAAFLVATALHAGHHATDLDLGGRGVDAWLLGALAILIAFALRRRLRRLGYVAGYVSSTTNEALAPFVGQKTVVLDTYRRDGSAVPTAVSIAVDGDRAVMRTFEKAGKTRRLRHDPEVRIAPSDSRGTPRGPAIRALARRLEGAEAREAARLLRRKYPLLHGVLVPLVHRVGRARTGRTVHFEATPDPEAHSLVTPTPANEEET